MTQEDALSILKMGHNAFVTGEAGAGKTHLINEYIDYLKKHKIKHAKTATTGIAATHLGGTTVHSFSGIGVREMLDDSDFDEIMQKERISKNFTDNKVLIIDEISMISRKQFDFIEKLARGFRGNNEPFGGLQIIVVGDFFQLPPVSRNRNVEFAFESPSWKKMNFAICYLHTQHRQKKGSLLSILTEIRNGEVNEETVERLNEAVVSLTDKDTDVTKLFTHNVNVDEFNKKQLDKIKGKEKVYKMESTGNKVLIENLKRSCLAPEDLVLKKGARVMFLKNNFEKGYVNGSIGHVLEMDSKYPLIELLVGKKIIGTPDEWIVEEDGKVKASISQLPLRLAWAIAIHKSQGLSLDEAVIDLSECFVEGQGYVALSRVRTMEGLSLLGFNKIALAINSKVKEFDAYIKKVSESTSLKLSSFESGEIKDRSKFFIKKTGGTEKAVTKEELETERGKVSTYEKTLALVKQKKDIAEIIKERKLSYDTVINHIEHLRLRSDDLDIEHLRTDDLPIADIVEVFERLDTTALSKVKEHFGDKYTFDELKLARLFLN